jgi:predicted transposase YbfD/YdcC
LFDYDVIAQDLVKTGSILQTSRNCNCTIDTVAKIAKAYSISYLTSQELNREKYSKAIDQYDLAGNLLHTFRNKEDAERWIRDNNISNSKGGAIHTHIVEVCKGKRKTAYGYKWQYTN